MRKTIIVKHATTGTKPAQNWLEFKKYSMERIPTFVTLCLCVVLWSSLVSMVVTETSVDEIDLNLESGSLTDEPEVSSSSTPSSLSEETEVDGIPEFSNECRLLACTIVCTTTTIQTVNNEVDRFVKMHQLRYCSNGVELKLTDIEFPDEKITKHWLNVDFNLTSLYIQTSSVNCIDARSFYNFYNLSFLRFNDMQVFDLVGKTLEGLTSLKTLWLLTLPVQNTEVGFLAPVRMTLEVLVINNLKWFPIDLYNYTGCTHLPALKALMMSYGMVQVIKKNIFDGLSAVMALTMIHCQIHSIEAGAFDRILNTIQNVDLRYNELRTVSGSFDQLVCVPWIQISVGDIFCDVMSSELLVLTQKHPNSFEYVECPNIETTTTKKPVTVEPPPFLNCIDNVLSVNDNDDTAPNPNYGTMIVVTPEDNDTVEIVLKGVSIDFFLILFDSHGNDVSSICLYSATGVFLLDNLVEEEVYTVCAMNKLRTTVSPFDCRPYYHEPKNQAVAELWLSEDDKVVTISTLIIVYLAGTGIGCILGYYVLKYNPDLLKGSNGVIIIRSMSKMSMSSTTTTTTLSQNDSSVKQSHDDEDYVDIQELSLPSGYEAAINPSRFECIKWQLDEAGDERCSKYAEISPRVAAPKLPLVEMAESEDVVGDRDNGKCDIVDSGVDENYI